MEIENNVISFTTSQGSTYSVDESGKTLRTKNSQGKGHGETETEPFSVFYVNTERADKILNEFNLGRSIRLGYEDNGTYYTIYDSNDLPKDKTPLILAFDQDKLVRGFKAELNPKIGLHPIEKLYNNTGNSFLHVGNSIIDITKSPNFNKGQPMNDLNKNGILDNQDIAPEPHGQYTEQEGLVNKTIEHSFVSGLNNVLNKDEVETHKKRADAADNRADQAISEKEKFAIENEELRKKLAEIDDVNKNVIDYKVNADAFDKVVDKAETPEQIDQVVDSVNIGALTNINPKQIDELYKLFNNMNKPLYIQDGDKFVKQGNSLTDVFNQMGDNGDKLKAIIQAAHLILNKPTQLEQAKVAKDIELNKEELIPQFNKKINLKPVNNLNDMKEVNETERTNRGVIKGVMNWVGKKIDHWITTDKISTPAAIALSGGLGLVAGTKKLASMTMNFCTHFTKSLFADPFEHIREKQREIKYAAKLRQISRATEDVSILHEKKNELGKIIKSHPHYVAHVDTHNHLNKIKSMVQYQPTPNSPPEDMILKHIKAIKDNKALIVGYKSDEFIKLVEGVLKHPHGSEIHNDKFNDLVKHVHKGFKVDGQNHQNYKEFESLINKGQAGNHDVKLDVALERILYEALHPNNHANGNIGVADVISHFDNKAKQLDPLIDNMMEIHGTHKEEVERCQRTINQSSKLFDHLTGVLHSHNKSIQIAQEALDGHKKELESIKPSHHHTERELKEMEKLKMQSKQKEQDNEPRQPIR